MTEQYPQSGSAQNAAPSHNVRKQYVSALFPSLLLGYFGLVQGLPTIQDARVQAAAGLIYLLVGALLAGPLFYRLEHRMPVPSWARGIVLGIALWLVEMLVISPAVGAGAFFANVGEPPLSLFGDIASSFFFFALWGSAAGSDFFIRRSIAIAVAPSCLLGAYAQYYEWAVFNQPASMAAALAYFLVGALICGPLFAALHTKIPGPLWLRGCLFGTALWLVDMLVVSPSIGGGLFTTKLGKYVELASLIAFVTWGGALGVIHSLIPSNKARRIASIITAAIMPCLILLIYTRLELAAATTPDFATFGALAYFVVGMLIYTLLFSNFPARIAGALWTRGILFGAAFWLIDMLVVLPIVGAGVFGLNLGQLVPLVSLCTFALSGGILGLTHQLTHRGWTTWRAVVVVTISLFFAAMVVRTALFQPLYINGESMIPTLMDGDDVIANKYPYGYSRYSLALPQPLFEFNGRIFAGQPNRGDLIIFRPLKDDSVDWVGRIVGLPGDRIQMIHGVLNINGVPVKRERIEPYATIDKDGYTHFTLRYRETLSNGVSYNTLNSTENSSLENTVVYDVPAGDYFEIADNRDDSTDSRVLSRVGYIPFENLIGRIDIILLRPLKRP